jgi:hypothetical protein
MEIRHFIDSDVQQIRNLFEICFGRKMSHDEWHWKYKTSPWGATAYVALDRNKIIGHYGAVRVPFRKNGKKIWAYQPCDVMMHLQYRGRILSRRPVIVKANEMFFEHNTMEFAFAFPTLRNARLHFLASKWSCHKHIALFKKDALAGNKLKNNQNILKIGWDIVASEDIDVLLKYCQNESIVHIEKNRNYLVWRYIDNPSEYYTVLSIKNMVLKKIVALAFVKFNRNEMNIHDLFISEGDKDYFSFWSMLESYAIKMKADIINVWLNPNENVAKYILDLGYRITEGAYLSTRIINTSKITQNYFFSRYAYRMGDLL